MGLQKTPGTEESTPASAPAPEAKAPAAAAQKPASKGTTLQLLAVKRPISDPTTGAVYDMNSPRPGVVKEGNWVHSQIAVGILKEWTPPGTPEIEA